MALPSRKELLKLGVLTALRNGHDLPLIHSKLTEALNDSSGRACEPNIETEPPESKTALLRAVEYTSYKYISIFMQLGADISHENARGETALSEAIKIGNRQMIEFLIEKGALLNAINKYDENAMTHFLRCTKKPDSIECEEENCEQLCTVDLNVADIEVDTSKVSNGKINITKDIGIKLKYPELDNMQKFITSGTDPTADEIFKLITESIEYIWEGEEIYKSRDTTKTELNDFIEPLNSEQFGRIRSFFEDMPRLSKDVPWTCTKCGKSTTVTLQGIDSFFG